MNRQPLEMLTGLYRRQRVNKMTILPERMKLLAFVMVFSLISGIVVNVIL